ncbi:GntR family transcriptional regulator [Companilactobacillus sp. RD055328]|uniref:GntR family transcriptional regulator n=1 Tax=Companilactobacillus sp. RD055328 TaxID=2916634 RepID=UPI001FC84C92|nr:GntR family transcriptional regulator [Companilactobacillus sp. RD055328]GKQ43188.1 GntR family transcriptional regulator [Companilactobacillus sp. RD055328]
MYFKFDEEKPLYLQIAQQIEDAILQGIYKPGDQIPSTTEVSKDYRINPATVLKGMNILVNKNLIEKKRGLGMFVTQDSQTEILENRQTNFYTDYVLDTVKRAQELNINLNELQNLIKKGYENE